MKTTLCYAVPVLRSTPASERLTHIKIKENIESVISKIPKEKYRKIFKGAYERPEKYIPKNKTRKIKKNYL